MKNETVSEKNNQSEDPIVMADECGDSMWDAVLGQEVKACEVKKAGSSLEVLFNKVDVVEVCDATEVK